MERLFLAPDLLGQLLGDGHELGRREILAMDLHVSGKPHGQHGFEHRLSRYSPSDQIDGDFLPLIGQLLSNSGIIVVHDPIHT